MYNPLIYKFLNANKIIIIILCSLIFTPQLIQAVTPNLDDIIAVNKKLPASKRPIQQAAALILWASQNNSFRSLGKDCFIKFDKTEKTKFDKIIKKLPKTGLAYVMKAIEDQKIRLIRDQALFIVMSNDGDAATFLLGTLDQLNELKSKQKQEAEEIVNQFYDIITNTFKFEKKPTKNNEEIDIFPSYEPEIEVSPEFETEVSPKFDFETDEGEEIIKAEYIKAINVLIKLYDYKFYGMTEAAHDHLIKYFKQHLFWDDIKKYVEREQVFYEAITYNEYNKHNEFIKIIKLIIDHVNGSKWEFNFDPKSILSELSAEDLRIQIDFIFNAANWKTNDEAVSDYSNQLLRLIIDDSDKISNALRARVLSFIEHSRPELYHSPGALLGYALKNPGKNIELLDSFISGSDQETLESKQAYLLSENMDIQLASAVLSETVMSRMNSSLVYSYLTRENVEPSIVRDIIKQVENLERETQNNRFFYFEDDSHETITYLNILMQENLNKCVLDTVLSSMKKTLNEKDITNIYISYIKNKDLVDPEIIEKILEDVKNFDELNRSLVYSAYIEVSTNETHIKLMIKDALKFKDYISQIDVLDTYKDRWDADDTIINDYNLNDDNNGFDF